MRTLIDVNNALKDLPKAMAMAASWLADQALVDSPELVDAENRVGHCYSDWRGAFRGEYDYRRQRWWFFCPMWHGGQAVKALVQAYKFGDNASWLRAAKMGGSFILRHRLTAGRDKGLLLAYEDNPNRVTISALLESIDGLLALADITDDARYNEVAIQAVQWSTDHAWIRGEGLVRDLYDPQSGRFIDRPYPTLRDREGRPLADDAVWLKIFHLTDEDRYRAVFYEILNRLLRDESPLGNWSSYGPCHISSGRIHPRHAYWWGRPLLAAWRDTNEEKWLEAAIRSGDWYRKAQRLDGGMFRDTDANFTTRSFGQSTSGILCAAIFWMELFEATRDSIWLEPIYRAMEFGMKMQISEAADPSLHGTLIEGTLDPDGTDRCPYFIRDLASIFFVQAASNLLAAGIEDNENFEVSCEVVVANNQKSLVS